MSEYTQRYQHVSHQELYDGVKAGDPEQIDGAQRPVDLAEGHAGRPRPGSAAATWTRWRNELDGDAAREFQRRLDLVVGYSGDLAEGMTDVHQGARP